MYFVQDEMALISITHTDIIKVIALMTVLSHLLIPFALIQTIQFSLDMSLRYIERFFCTTSQCH